MLINLTSKFNTFICGLLLLSSVVFATDSIPRLKSTPKTYQDAWIGYDPRKDPLEVKVFKKWEQDGLILRCVKFVTGTFKGQKSYIAGIYAVPKGGQKLPGIVVCHGGGGRATAIWTMAFAKRGYATMMISWRVDERYLSDNKLPPEAQTDWGAVEGHQSKDALGILPSNDKKYDPFPSPRNDGFFLRTIAARRALTFLEQQPEVNPDKLGFYGHSMGAELTFYVSSVDRRIKTSAPSAGPKIHHDDTLQVKIASPNAAAKSVTCPILFLSPSQDHHCLIEGVEWFIDNISTKNYRISRAIHYQHASDAASVSAVDLWFDAYLKNNIKFPEQPAIQLISKPGEYPMVRVTPDNTHPISHVDVYSTRDGENNREQFAMITRYFRFTKAIKKDKSYVAPLKIFGNSNSLWVFANVHYKIQDPSKLKLQKPCGTFNVTTRMIMKTPAELKSSMTKYVTEPTTVIESFEEDWEKNWLIKGTTHSTCKFNDISIRKPENAVLSIKYRASKEGSLKIDFRVGLGTGGTVYRGVFPLNGSNKEETLLIKFSEMRRGENRTRPAHLNVHLSSWNDDEFEHVKFTMDPGSAKILQIAWQEGK